MSVTAPSDSCLYRGTWLLQPVCSALPEPAPGLRASECSLQRVTMKHTAQSSPPRSSVTGMTKSISHCSSPGAQVWGWASGLRPYALHFPGTMSSQGNTEALEKRRHKGRLSTEELLITDKAKITYESILLSGGWEPWLHGLRQWGVILTPDFPFRSAELPLWSASPQELRAQGLCWVRPGTPSSFQVSPPR